MKFCEYCNNPIPVERTGTLNGTAVYRRFCNRSCSASFNGSKYPKRKLEGICPCGTAVPSSRKYCFDCRPRLRKNWGAVIYDDLVGRAKYQRNSQVRAHARKVMSNSNIPKECKECGYSLYVEVSHIKPISSFSGDSLVIEINDLSNLEYLCPNHHREHEENFKETQV